MEEGNRWMDSGRRGLMTARRGLLGESREKMRRIGLIKDGAGAWDGNRSGLLWSAPDATRHLTRAACEGCG